MKIFVKSAKLKYFSKEEGEFFNFSPVIRRIKNIETQVGFLDTDNKALVNELKTKGYVTIKRLPQYANDGNYEGEKTAGHTKNAYGPP